jgi:hypothetical protein
MENTQLTAAQIAELQRLQKLQSEVAALDQEINLLDAGINEASIIISSLEDLKAADAQLRSTIQFEIKNECDRIRNNKAARSCRAEKMIKLDTLANKVFGLGENQKVWISAKNAKIANRQLKVDARTYKKTQVANSILLLAQQGIDARSNLAGSILNGIANVAGAVGGAITGQPGQNYTLPGQSRTLAEVIDQNFTNPLTGAPDTTKILTAAAIAGALLFGILIIIKRKK